MGCEEREGTGDAEAPGPWRAQARGARRYRPRALVCLLVHGRVWNCPLAELGRPGAAHVLIVNIRQPALRPRHTGVGFLRHTRDAGVGVGMWRALWVPLGGQLRTQRPPEPGGQSLAPRGGDR